MWYMKFIGKNPFIDYCFRKAVHISIVIKLKHRIQKNTEYYIIRRPHSSGFFSDFFFVLGHCMIAEKFGLKPCVDMETFPSLYSEGYEVGETRNAWEYYFQQSNKLNEVLNKTYIVCEEKYPYGKVPYYATTCLGKEGYPDKKKVKELQQPLMHYASIKNDIRIEFDAWGGANDITNCVGVHVRGTDMKHTPGHFVPTDVSEVIQYVRRTCKYKNIRKIFICSDENEIIKQFEDALSNQIKVVYTDTYRSIDGCVGLHMEKERHTERKNHKYMLGYEVLRDVYLLSKCKALIHGRSNVAYAAIVMNDGKYEWHDCI